MAYALVLDSETTSITKPFCYDLSWVIISKTDGKIVDFKAYVVEQVWHNLPLFESAYYKDKREKYVYSMRRHEYKMDKWGYILRDLARDIKKYSIEGIYAYNSDFDDGVIKFMCDWYKTINPIETIPIFDIWGYASECITNQPAYQTFCEDNERFTDSGNYKGSAEVVYQFITDNPDFVEEHMGLFDSQIEAAILYECVSKYHLTWDTPYTVNKILNRVTHHPFSIKVDGTEVYKGNYVKKYVRNDTYNFKTT